MKNYFLSFQNRIVLIILSAVLFFAFDAKAQNFQIKWGMNGNLSGASTSSNFAPGNAALSGAVPHQLGAYLTDGNGGQAFRTRNWPVNMSKSSYIEVSFSANVFEYNITSLSFRVKRSATGPQSVVVKSGSDNYGSDLSSYSITKSDLFYQVTVPLSFTNISDPKFSFRIYGFSSSGDRPDFGTLYFDDIIINGKVTTFILPLELTYFTANYTRNVVNLAWETAWEKNSREFVVERSIDLFEFVSIGNLEAGGDANGRLQYNFIDEAPLPGVSYYRLKMVDNDDYYSYSEARDVVIHSEFERIMVCPNPVSANLIRILKNNIDLSTVILTNYLGQNISFDIVDFKDSYINIYPHKSLSSGLYILSLLQNGRKLHAKVLVP